MYVQEDKTGTSYITFNQKKSQFSLTLTDGNILLYKYKLIKVIKGE